MENQPVKNIQTKILSDQKYILSQVEFEYHTPDGEWEKQKKEVFDAGNAATVLLYNPKAGTIILNRQFRIASYLNGNPTGMLLEVSAGKLEDGETPEETMIRELKEETGFEISDLQPVFKAYMSPGAYTELVHFYVATYKPEQQTADGGGLVSEHEHIEVVEILFKDAYAMIANGEIVDGKTILLLQYAQIHRLLES